MAAKTKALPPLPADVYWERAVADAFGVSRQRLRRWRHEHLQAEDWRMHENAVMITACGLAKLRGVLTGGSASALAEVGAATGTGGAATSPPELAPGPPPRQKFVVTRVPVHRVNTPQTHLILAWPVPDDFAPCAAWELVRRLAGVAGGRERPVRVRDNSHFATGMVFEGVAIGAGMWQYRGRLPRKPGKW